MRTFVTQWLGNTEFPAGWATFTTEPEAEAKRAEMELRRVKAVVWELFEDGAA